MSLSIRTWTVFAALCAVSCRDASDPPLAPEPAAVWRIAFSRPDSSLNLHIFDSIALSAQVVNEKDVPRDPQPAFTWAITTLSGTQVIERYESLGTLLARGIGEALISVFAESLSATLPVVVTSPVASLSFALQADTITWNHPVPWILEARDSTGALLPERFGRVTSTDTSVVSVVFNEGVSVGLGVVELVATAPPLVVKDTLTVIPLRVAGVEPNEVNICYMLLDARVACWGNNAYLQLGLLTERVCTGLVRQYCWYGGSGGIVAVPNLDDVRTMDVGSRHVCALRNSGDIRCWGSNRSGELGSSGGLRHCDYAPEGYFGPCTDIPVPIESSLAFRAISTGSWRSCALTVDDAAWCWGSDDNPERITAGGDVAAHTPLAVGGGHRFRSIDAGTAVTCAVDFDDAAWCWGSSSTGALGAGPGVSRATVPTPVVGGIKFTSVASAPWGGTCGLSTAGQAFCWGGFFYGGTPLPEGCADDLVPNSCHSTPVAVGGDLRFVELSVGNAACGRTDAGEVWCWYSTPPARVLGAPPFTRLSGGSSLTCGMSDDNDAYCWQVIDGQYTATRMTGPRD